jgi:rRNA maturation endonuclease Nob1
MAKTKRGNNIKKILNWRGICPVCKRTGVKLLWDKLSEDGTIKVCKVCGNK